MNSRLHIVGVRHHSPACARLVAHEIRRLRPAYVLVEGPADMNGRLDELRLGHTPPIAVFSWHRAEEGRTVASWSPFCAYSPEWVAFETAAAVGAEFRFIDLPAWDKAFWGVANRYSDGARRHSRAVERLCARFHVEGYDALWDHLFEGPEAPEAIRDRLAAYFLAMRGDEEAGERDGPREALMRAFIGTALAKTDRPILVVCGGYHAPALHVEEPGSEDWPVVPLPENASSTLVPWSYRRLDAFSGYQSGMPSPGYYDAVWTLGAAKAPEALLAVVVHHLRAKKQAISPADVIAGVTLAEGLGRLRGHDALRRTDLLDGLASALVKGALDAPLPWSGRGIPGANTDALLMEMLVALTGTAEGRLHARTPRPPLLADAEQELAKYDLAPTIVARTVKLDLADAKARDRSRVLHRMRVLGIPGFTRQRGPAFATDAELEELWVIARDDNAISSLLEASAFGPTLAGAAARKLEEAFDADDLDLGALVVLLADAVFVGIDTLTDRGLAAVRARVGTESDLGPLGTATERLLGLWSHDGLFGARHSPELAAALVEAYDRGVWLLEQQTGASSPQDGARVSAVRALRDCARTAPRLSVSVDELCDVCHRATASQDMPPALRGACLGALWSLGRLDGADQAAVQAVRRSSLPAVLGDFLAGLFAVAREETVHKDDVLVAIDEAVGGLTEDDLLIALPALRLAFGFFPPREKVGIATRIAGFHGHAAKAHMLLRLEADADSVARGRVLDAEVEAALGRYGLAVGGGG